MTTERGVQSVSSQAGTQCAGILNTAKGLAVGERALLGASLLPSVSSLLECRFGCNSPFAPTL